MDGRNTPGNQNDATEKKHEPREPAARQSFAFQKGTLVLAPD